MAEVSKASAEDGRVLETHLVLTVPEATKRKRLKRVSPFDG